MPFICMLYVQQNVVVADVVHQQHVSAFVLVNILIPVCLYLFCWFEKKQLLHYPKVVWKTMKVSVTQQKKNNDNKNNNENNIMNATFKPNNKKNNEYGKCGKIKKNII